MSSLPKRELMSDAHVAFALDAGYFIPTVVAMHSLLRHWSRRKLTVHIIGQEIQNCHVAAFQRLQSRASVNCKIEFLHIADQLKDFPRVGHLAPSTFTRVLLPILLPDIGELLYLDGDLLALEDLSDYPSADSHLGLAAQELDKVRLSDPSGISYCLKDLQLDGNSPLFNPGVFVMNLRRWRDEGITDRIVSFVKRYRNQLKYSDQDAINGICVGRIGRLPYSWNTSVGSGWPTSPGTRVVHYTGSMKPWNSGICRPSVRRWLSEATRAFDAAGLAYRSWALKRAWHVTRSLAANRMRRLSSQLRVKSGDRAGAR